MLIHQTGEKELKKLGELIKMSWHERAEAIGIINEQIENTITETLNDLIREKEMVKEDE